jgi:hypothetical protein
VLLQQVGGGPHDQLQPAPVLGDGAQLLVGAQRGADGGDQPGVGQLGLGPVVVDVVLVDHRQLGGVAGLAGAQDEPALQQAQGVADVADQLQAGLVGLHHRVQQRHRDVRVLAQVLPRLLDGVGVQQAQGPPEDGQVVQHETGGAVDLVVVVHHEDHPWRWGRRIAARRRVRDRSRTR